MEVYMCPIHNKAMATSKYGPYCKTPIEKNGETVTKWCDYKPGTDTKPEPVEVRESIEEKTDWNEVNRGKCRSLVVQALIKNGGEMMLNEIANNPTTRKVINRVADYMMKGDEF